MRGAKTREEAHAAARSLVGSNLMKTSIGGGRLDWGRVVAALGASGARYVHERFTLAYGDAVLVKKGKHQGERAARAALEHLGEREVRLTVDLGLGRGEARGVRLRPQRGLRARELGAAAHRHAVNGELLASFTGRTDREKESRDARP